MDVNGWAYVRKRDFFGFRFVSLFDCHYYINFEPPQNGLLMDFIGSCVDFEISANARDFYRNLSYKIFISNFFI